MQARRQTNAHTCLHIHTITYSHAHTHTLTHTCMHMHTHACTNSHTHTHTHTYMHAHAHASSHTHKLTHTHTYMHAHAHASSHTQAHQTIESAAKNTEGPAHGLVHDPTSGGLVWQGSLNPDDEEEQKEWLRVQVGVSVGGCVLMCVCT